MRLVTALYICFVVIFGCEPVKVKGKTTIDLKGMFVGCEQVIESQFNMAFCAGCVDEAGLTCYFPALEKCNDEAKNYSPRPSWYKVIHQRYKEGWKARHPGQDWPPPSRAQHQDHDLPPKETPRFRSEERS